MEIFNRESLRELAAFSGGTCVSVYVPARRMGANTSIDMTRMRNLIRTVEAKVADGTLGADGAALLDPLREILENHSTWRESEKALAMFVAPGMVRTFRVPVEVEEGVMVADRFDVVPLLSLGIEDGTFLLLSLSQNNVQLFRATRQGFEPLIIDRHLTSLDEFTRFVSVEKQSHMHSGNRAVRGARSKENVVFHGGDDSANRRKQDLHEFFVALDHQVAHLAGEGDIPLLLAGVDYVRAMYRNVSRCRHIVESGIEGNIDHLPLNALHEAGWKLMEPHFGQHKDAALEKLRALAGTGLTADGQEEIAAASDAGRVETLFVTANGRVGSSNDLAAQHDLAIMRLIGPVISAGGNVYSVVHGDLPTQSGVAAVMRY